MIPPYVEAQVRRYFKGAALEKKLAELKDYPDAAQQEAIQGPMRAVLVDALKEYVDTKAKEGIHVAPAHITVVLLCLMSANVISGRDKHLSIHVIVQQMIIALVRSLHRWFDIAKQDESKTQPGG